MNSGNRIKSRKYSRSRMSRDIIFPIKLKQFKKKQSNKTKKCICLPSNYVHVEFPPVWSELRANRQLCDGVIQCGGNKTFHVHRAILSAVSPYFKALFTNSLKNGKVDVNEVKIDIIPAFICELILDFAYTGSCKITSDNVEQLLAFADQFEVLGIVQLCCQFLFDQLTPENCLGIFKFARHYFCRNLEEKGRKFIRCNFKQIVKESQELKDIAVDELELILQDDELNVRYEELIFEAIKLWIETKIDERKKYVPRLLNCVRFGFMNSKFFNDEVLCWKIFHNDKEYKRILHPMSTYLTGQNSRTNGESNLKNPFLRPRIPHEILFAIGGWSAGSPTSFIETYDTRADKWFLSVNTDVIPKAYHGICTLNNLIYVIGGFDGNNHFNTVRCFNPVTKKWKERACMYHARCYVSVCTHDRKIYALGGYNGRIRMNSAERYDPERNQWEIIPSMHRQRSDASAAALGKKIYIVGGFNGHEVLQSAEVFDTETNQWSYICSMNIPRSGVSLVAFRDNLYALGGFNGYSRLSSGERFTPYNNQGWQEISEMFCPRSNFAIVILDEMIYVIGGFNGSTTIAFVECYDVDVNEWYEASAMNLNRSALGACVVAGLKNAREYSYLSKALNHNQGKKSKNQDRPNQSGEGSSMALSTRNIGEPHRQLGPIDGMAEGINHPLPDGDMNSEDLPGEH